MLGLYIGLRIVDLPKASMFALDGALPRSRSRLLVPTPYDGDPISDPESPGEGLELLQRPVLACTNAVRGGAG